MIREAIRNSVITESNSEIKKNAERMGPEATKALRSEVNKLLKIKKKLPYYEGETSPKRLVDLVNDVFNNYRKEAEAIFDFTYTGIGRGEILLSYLFENLNIFGGKGNYDVDFDKNKLEVKEVKLSNDYMRNFRLGRDYRPAMNEALSEIKYLHSVAKWYLPELNTEEANERMEFGTEWTGMIKFFKKVNKSHIEGNEILDLQIKNNGTVYRNGVKFSNIKDMDFVRKIHSVIDSPKKVKLFSQIERELIRNFNKVHVVDGYLFFLKGPKGLELKLIDDFSGSYIDTITQGIIKIAVPYK